MTQKLYIVPRCCRDSMVAAVDPTLPGEGWFFCSNCLSYRKVLSSPSSPSSPRSLEGWDDGLLAKLIGPEPTPKIKVIPWEIDRNGACVCHSTGSICFMCPSSACQHDSCRASRYKRYTSTMKYTKFNF
jgi:hypothetical protein